MFELEVGIRDEKADFRPPGCDDNVAFADNVCGNLLNNIYFNMKFKPFLASPTGWHSVIF